MVVVSREIREVGIGMDVGVGLWEGYGLGPGFGWIAENVYYEG